MGYSVRIDYTAFLCPHCGNEFMWGACETCDNCGEYSVGNPAQRHRYQEITDKRIRIFKKTDGKCYYCGETLEITHFHAEHKTPKSRGGSDFDDNIVPSCARCNCEKGTMTEQEFVEYVGAK